MPRINTWSCKTCGKLKGDTNDWWLVGDDQGTFTVRAMPGPEDVGRWHPWPPQEYEDAVCGREHVQREVELFLAEGLELVNMVRNDFEVLAKKEKP